MDTSQASQKLRRQARPWVENLARCGYAAKGVVYVLIGMLALQAALGAGGKTTDTQGVLFTIAHQTFGRLILFLLGLGLGGYALWRLVMAGWDSENKGRDAKAVAQRIGYALSGLAYGGLAFTAFQLAWGVHRSGGGHSARYDWTARVLEHPLGGWLIALVGLIIIGVAFSALYKAYSAQFREHLKTGSMSRTETTWVTRAGRAGYAARGVVFLLVGWFFIRAALYTNAKETGGLDEALTTLARQPHGLWLLGIVAVGLIAYGLYGFCEAYYRRVDA
jgi:hypothetical protein